MPTLRLERTRNRMGHRLTKIYTRTGDGGETGLGDGSRVTKNSLRIEAIGAVDGAQPTVSSIEMRPQTAKGRRTRSSIATP